MASFSMEDFIGNGALKGLLPKLVEEGWDDVPTLKIMNSEDMDAINMTQQQKVCSQSDSGSQQFSLEQFLQHRFSDSLDRVFPLLDF